MLGRRQPLQWCQTLKYFDANAPRATAKPAKLMQTFPGHYVKHHVPHSFRGDTKLSNAPSPAAPPFDDRYVERTPAEQKSHIEDVRITYENIWPNNKNLRTRAIIKSGQKASVDGTAQEPKNLIALASFPGSGNTWLRYLLQQATGKFYHQIRTVVFLLV